VTHFGAFVDVGVKQDGLVHISQLADRFVKDPNEVVKVGDKLQVRVLELDIERKRISLTCRSENPPQRQRPNGDSEHASDGRRPQGQGQGPSQGQGRGQSGRGSQSQSQNANKSGGGFSNNPFANILKK
jgi:uncharacterized protein